MSPKSRTRSSSYPVTAPISALGRVARRRGSSAGGTNPALGAIPFALLIFFAGTAVAATQQGITAMANWKTMDNCARQAQAAFPDFNADSNAKRDAKLRACLAGSNLPPRQPETPAPAR